MPIVVLEVMALMMICAYTQNVTIHSCIINSRVERAVADVSGISGTQPPGPTATDNTGDAISGPAGGDLSTGAKAGIGIDVSLSILLILAAILRYARFRKRAVQRQTTPLPYIQPQVGGMSELVDTAHKSTPLQLSTYPGSELEGARGLSPGMQPPLEISGQGRPPELDATYPSPSPNVYLQP